MKSIREFRRQYDKITIEAEDAVDTVRAKLDELDGFSDAVIARIDELEKAIKWILNDASYKAPESIDHTITERWIGALRKALPDGE